MSNTFKMMMQFSFPLNIDLILQERQPCHEMLYSNNKTGNEGTHGIIHFKQKLLFLILTKFL